MAKDRPSKRHKAAHDPSSSTAISTYSSTPSLPILMFSPADPRFASLQTDERYRLPSKRQTHVRLDKRFKHMLHDDEFSRTATVDRYGRALPKGEGRKQLERFYQFEEEDEDGEGDDDEEVEAELHRIGVGERDIMREWMASNDEESSSEEETDEEDVDEETEFPDKQGGEVPMGEVSARIAVVNLDWDNIRAADLFAVFSSFTSSSGKLLEVSVYPSEFGRERMEQEETEGPPKEIFASKPRPGVKDSDSEDESGEEDDEQIKESIVKEDEGEEFDSAILRRYQLERLRYYYAVLTFSSSAAAKAVYDSIDGTEYLSTANFFDLRFIPDDTDFSDDKPRDECDKIPDGYKPTEFVTDALQHSKVKLTWDADDAVRKEAQAKAFRGGRKEIDENDLKAYLGSDSEISSVEDGPVDNAADTNTAKNPATTKKEAERHRMRALLGLGADPTPKSKSKSSSSAPVGDMQITFTSGLSSSGPTKSSVFENSPENEETTVEKYARREKERRQRRKDKMKASKNDFPSAGVSQDPDQKPPSPSPEPDLGFDDPFFSTENLDPTAASKAARKEERRKKREQRAAEEASAAAQKAELDLLMAADGTETTLKHFDMHDIEKAEKKAKKRGKKGKGKREDAEQARQEGFEMDVGDERFQGVFEDSSFAIDPMNPRFKGTEGMKRLLEEGRRRRKNGGESEIGLERSVGKKEKTSKKLHGEGTSKGQSVGDDEWKMLVEKFKGNDKRKRTASRE
jgi:hypothetical protein